MLSEVVVGLAKLDGMNGVQRPLGWWAPLPDSQAPLGTQFSAGRVPKLSALPTFSGRGEEQRVLLTVRRAGKKLVVPGHRELGSHDGSTCCSFLWRWLRDHTPFFPHGSCRSC